MFKLLIICFVVFFNLSTRSSEVDFGCNDRKIELALYDLGLLYSSKINAGIDKELVELLKNKTGCRFNVSVKPRARIWGEVESGATDITVSGIATNEREKFAYFINYITAKNFALFRKSSNLKSFEDFEKHNGRSFIGVVRSFKHGAVIDQFIEKMKKQNRVKEYPAYDDVFKALEKGQIDLMFSLQLVFPFHKNIDEFLVVDVGSELVPHGLVLGRRSFTEKQMKNWRKLVNELLQKKEIDRILVKYLREPYLSSSKI